MQAHDFQKLRLKWGTLGVYETGYILDYAVATQVLSLVESNPLYDNSHLSAIVVQKDGSRFEVGLL
jgi:hypothetical protein